MLLFLLVAAMAVRCHCRKENIVAEEEDTAAPVLALPNEGYCRLVRVSSIAYTLGPATCILVLCTNEAPTPLGPSLKP